MMFLKGMLINRLVIALLSGLGGHAASEFNAYFSAFCKVIS